MTEETSANLHSLRRSLRRMVEDDGGSSKGGGAEKRRHDRHLYMTEVTVRYVKRFEQVSDSPDEFVVITKDLSRSGISFIHQSQMYTGEIVAVEVTVGGTKKNLLVRIARCRRAGLKVFDIAGEFISSDEAETASAGQTETSSEPDEAESAGDGQTETSSEPVAKPQQ